MTIKYAEYYVSDSANVNDAKENPASDPKTVTHTSDGKKINVVDPSNKILQQEILSNWTLPIFITTMYPNMEYRIVTFGGTSHTRRTPTTKEVIMDVVRRSVHINQTPRYEILIGRYASTPGNTCIYVSSLWDESSDWGDHRVTSLWDQWELAGLGKMTIYFS